MHTRRADQKTIARLQKRAEFLRVAAMGTRWVTPIATLQMAVREGPGPHRYGLTIPKKIWQRAVDRNRVRRRLRAAMLAALVKVAVPTHGAYDFVVLPKAAAHTAPYDQLVKDLSWALTRLLAGDGGPAKKPATPKGARP
jgi:ribonuclease P protein component